MLHDIKHPLSTKILNPNFKNHFFLDLAKSGRSGQYLVETGPKPDLKKVAGSTGTETGTGFPVAHCLGSNSLQVVFHFVGSDTPSRGRMVVISGILQVQVEQFWEAALITRGRDVQVQTISLISI